MFNRQKNQPDPQSPEPGGSWRDEMRRRAENPGPHASSGGGAAPEPSIDEMFARLGSLGAAEPDDEATPSRLTEEASSHSGALRSALKAQEQAQQLLDLATKERAEATGQAEQILLEAQAMATRLGAEAEQNAERKRRESAAWATDQRRAVEEVVAELESRAKAEAEATRKEALERALAEADEVGAARVEELVAAGKQEADEIRNRAQDVLERSSALAAETQVSVQLFTDSVASFMVGLQRNSTRLEELLAEVEAGRDSDDDTDGGDERPDGEDADADDEADDDSDDEGADADTTPTSTKRPQDGQVPPQAGPQDRS